MDRNGSKRVQLTGHCIFLVRLSQGHVICWGCPDMPGRPQLRIGAHGKITRIYQGDGVWLARCRYPRPGRRNSGGSASRPC